MTKPNEFVKVIGKRRFSFLLVLLAFTGMLAGLWQYWMDPQHEQLITEKATLESDRTRLQREIIELPQKYKELAANEVRYEKLVETGFLTEQDRILARSEIDTIRMHARLRGIGYNIQPQEVIPNPQGGTDNTIYRTKISVDMKGLTDLEMREFIKKMTTEFRGLVVAKNIALKRDNDPTHDKLLDLTSKRVVDFISGKVDFEWYTVVPKSSGDKKANISPSAAMQTGQMPSGVPATVVPGGHQ